MIYQKIISASQEKRKQLAVLIDPDKTNEASLMSITRLLMKHEVDFVFVGGSLMTGNFLDSCIQILKENIDIPIVLFPGNTMHISHFADGILLLSLISGRNPELLIGNHVAAAPILHSSKLEIMPTGYMLIESGKMTSVLYMSNTHPIPADKSDIACCTALAGQMLGLKMIYMDAGSGAINPINESMIRHVSSIIDIPLIIGGGIRSAENARTAWSSGADMIVMGNGIEMQKELIETISYERNKLNNVETRMP